MKKAQNLADHGPVKDWLHLATKRMLDIFQMTNLYQVPDDHRLWASGRAEQPIR